MKKIMQITMDIYYFNSLGSSEPMDIKGYDYFFDSRIIMYNSRSNESTAFSIDFDYESSTLKITQDGKDIYKKDLMDFANKLIDKYGINKMNKSYFSRGNVL